MEHCFIIMIAEGHCKTVRIYNAESDQISLHLA